jgi:hypothetical protein
MDGSDELKDSSMGWVVLEELGDMLAQHSLPGKADLTVHLAIGQLYEGMICSCSLSR